MLAWIRRWWRHDVDVAHLEDFNDRMLADIGLTRTRSPIASTATRNAGSCLHRMRHARPQAAEPPPARLSPARSEGDTPRALAAPGRSRIMFGCPLTLQRRQPPNEVSPRYHKEAKMQFHIQNMTCSGCARSVTMAIRSVDKDAVVTADPKATRSRSRPRPRAPGSRPRSPRQAIPPQRPEATPDSVPARLSPPRRNRSASGWPAHIAPPHRAIRRSPPSPRAAATPQPVRRLS